MTNWRNIWVMLNPYACIRAFKEHPDRKLTELLPIIMRWLNQDVPQDSNSSSSKPKLSQGKSTKPDQWQTLDTADLRFQFSQKESEHSFYEHLKAQTNVVFDLDHWIKQVS